MLLKPAGSRHVQPARWQRLDLRPNLPTTYQSLLVFLEKRKNGEPSPQLFMRGTTLTGTRAAAFSWETTAPPHWPVSAGERSHGAQHRDAKRLTKTDVLISPIAECLRHKRNPNVQGNINLGQGPT